MITIQQLDRNKWLIRNLINTSFRPEVTVHTDGCHPSLDAAINHLIPPGTGKDLKLRIVTLGLEEQKPRFATLYGLAADTVVNNPSLTKEEAQKMLDNLHEHFPTINAYRKRRK